MFRFKKVRLGNKKVRFMVKKESGLTNHVERWNNTLRQRLGRFVRKTLSFSKCEEMHVACLSLFVHRYNLELVKSF